MREENTTTNTGDGTMTHAKHGAMHYCRLHFVHKEDSTDILVMDFGYFGTAQRMASTKKLQEFYPEYSLRKNYVIPEEKAFKYEYPITPRDAARIARKRTQG